MLQLRQKVKSMARLFFYFLLFTQGWIIISGFFNLPWWWVLLAAYIGFLAYLYPWPTLLFSLFIMPIFGSRPPDTQAHYLYFLFATVLIGIYSNLFHNQQLCKRLFAKLREPNAVLLFVALFVVVSLLSLVGLPILGAIKHTIEEDPLYIFKELLPVGETTLFYSIASQLYLFQAIFIGLYVYGIAKPSNQLRLFKQVLLVLLGGWALTVLYGYLEFFGILQLYFRTPDNPTRFISFFPNSTWTAQYLSLIMPLLGLLLLFLRKSLASVVLLVLLLVVGEVGLILAMERGAWVTYPPILFVIWVMIYYILAKAKENKIDFKTFFAKNWLKVFITIPLTVTFSVLIVYGIKHLGDQGLTKSVIEATGKAKKIAQANDRTKHWPPALKFYGENPLFGGGGDSFGWQYKVYYYQKDAKWHDEPSNALHPGQFGTAHNLYLETLVGKGIFGLLFLLGIFFTSFVKLFKKELFATNLEESIIGLIVFASLSAAFIYSNVQVITYTQPVAVIFWLMVFMAAGLTHNYIFSRSLQLQLAKIAKYTIYLMLLLLPFHVTNISFIKEFVAQKLSDLFAISSDSSTLIVGAGIWLAVFGVVISFITHYRVIRYSLEDGFLVDELTDKPQLFHDRPTPRAGGIGIYLTNFLVVFNPLGWKFLAASLPAFIAGLMDDFSSLSPKVRLVFQIISAALAVFLLEAMIDSLGFGIDVPFWLGAILTIIAITGVINAINIIDGFNGLAGGFSLLAFLSIAYVAYKVDDMVILEIAFINIAALLGFLALNFPKGKIFLGDGGAYFLGFALASLSLLLHHNHPEVSQWYPLALLAYPVFEVIFTIYRRKFLDKKEATLHDNNHLHQIIFRSVTKNNPKTSLYLLIRVVVFIAITTFFHESDIGNILVFLGFVGWYIIEYKKVKKS